MRIRHCHWTARGRLLPARLIFPLQYWHRRLCVWAVCVRESLGIEIAHDHVLQPFTTMPDTISESTVRHTVIAAVDAVAGDIQHAARQELDALRSAITARLAALERALDRDVHEGAFDPVVEKLCAVAAEQADNASSAARAQATETAARELAEARERAQTELHAVRAQSEAARLAFEERLTQSTREQVEAALALAEAERIASAAAQHDAEVSAATLEEARVQIARLEQERAELEVARNIAEAHLEGDLHKRVALEAELDTARETARQAQADVDGSRLDLQHATDRLRFLEEQKAREGAAIVLDHVGAALQTLAAAATTGPGLLDALLDLLVEHFSRTAVCVLGPRGCVVWGSRGFDPPPASSKDVIALPADSPLMRASADCQSAIVRAADAGGLLGLLGEPVGYAIALPIVASSAAERYCTGSRAPQFAPARRARRVKYKLVFPTAIVLSALHLAARDGMSTRVAVTERACTK